MMIDINRFISDKVTKRSESYFQADLTSNHGKLFSEINGKKVLVIGGAGTIGGSFIKALLPFRPGALVVVDVNENGLTELTRDVRSTADLFVPDTYLTYPISFSSPVFKKMIGALGPFDIIANFAAHKHVRSEKDVFSIEAMIENNTMQAKYLLDMLLLSPPKHFFCVSTDKAANPVNIMGASKKIMEDVIMAYSSRMKITTARFANVAFSNGSLPAGFIERIMKRQPISAPADVRRYFVSPTESGQLCLLACILGNTGEVFFPKLGVEQTTTFSAIASDFLRMMGFEPDECSSEQEAKEKARALNDQSTSYPVYYFSSDTSGEKAYEEFYTEDEEISMDRYEALGVISNLEKKSIDELTGLFERLRTALDKQETTKPEIVAILKDYLQNFEHIETGKSLDQKM